MRTRNIVIAIVVFIVLLVWFKGCYNVDITKKPTTKGLVIQVLENLGILNAKVDTLAADVDTIKVDVRELKNRKGPAVIWRTKTVVVPQTQSSYASVPLRSVEQPTEEPQRPVPQISAVTPGSTEVSPQDLLFCIDLEPSKSSDASKKFLFWELIHTLGYNIPKVIPNFTGRSANMLLKPGEAVNDLAAYDGDVLRMSIVTVERYYSLIFGVPAPAGYAPAIRSNRGGWSGQLMTRSGGYFVSRF